MPAKKGFWRQIAPESSPERSAKSLSHSFFVVPFLSPRGGCAIKSESCSKISVTIFFRSLFGKLVHIFRELVHIFGAVSAYFRAVSAYLFREVRAYFRSETRFQNFETSFEKFGAIMATGGLH